MAADCPERIDLQFLRWIWRYPERRLPAVMERIAAVAGERRIEILRSDAEVRRFLARASDMGGEGLRNGAQALPRWFRGAP